VVYAQTAIVAGIAVGKEIGNLDRVAAIEIATTRRGYEQAGRDREKWTPENRDTADHSLPYLAARAMYDATSPMRATRRTDCAIRAFLG